MISNRYQMEDINQVNQITMDSMKMRKSVLMTMLMIKSLIM